LKGKRTDLGDANCGIARALDVVGEWWTLLIVREAFKGRQRFSEFQKALGIARNILTTRLRKLVSEGVLAVEPDPDSPAGHLYVLTLKGRQLGIVLVALWQWGEEHCTEAGNLGHTIVDTAEGRPLPRLQLKAEDGRDLEPHGFRVAAVRTPDI